jgi:hypothetical protein
MKQRYFAFLRRLHAKGRNNMYGAVPYLMQAFDLSRDQAFAVVCEWIDLQHASVDADGPPPATTRHLKRTPPESGKRRKRSRASI